MGGMILLVFVLYFYAIVKIEAEYGDTDNLVILLSKYCLYSSIVLMFDYILLIVMIIIAISFVFPVAVSIYLMGGCCCSEIRPAMNKRVGLSVDENRVDRDFFYNFVRGTSWTQMLLYIFKNNKIVFKKNNFTDNFETSEVDNQQLNFENGHDDNDEKYLNLDNSNQPSEINLFNQVYTQNSTSVQNLPTNPNENSMLTMKNSNIGDTDMNNLIKLIEEEIKLPFEKVSLVPIKF